MQEPMSSSESHLFVVQRKDGPARIAFSDGLLARLPAYHVRLLKRIAAAAPPPWPPNILFVSEDEYRTTAKEACRVLVPDWLIVRIQEWEKKKTCYGRAVRRVWPSRETWQWAYVIYHSLSEERRGELGNCPDSSTCRCSPETWFYLRTLARLVTLWTILSTPFLLTWGFLMVIASYLLLRFRLLLRPSDRNALFQLARIRYSCGRGEAFNRTKQRLLRIGATPQQVTKLNRMQLPQDMTMLKKFWGWG